MLLTQHEVDYKLARLQGMTAERAFERVFKDDPEWEEFFLELPEDPKKRKAEIRWAARELEKRKEMGELQKVINKRVADLANVALDTMEEILVEGKSEKVKAEVAIELLRQNVGNPDKDQSNVNVQVVIGKDPMAGVVDGEVVDDRY
jgi:hypothetical protein